MIKKYQYITFLFLLFSVCVTAQETKDTSSKGIEILNDYISVYPNPMVSGSRLFISSKTSTPKYVEIFDVLGKRVFLTTASSKEINASLLIPGVYIIKISDENQSASRKLIIK